jgi:hypothetical protein
MGRPDDWGHVARPCFWLCEQYPVNIGYTKSNMECTIFGKSLDSRIGKSMAKAKKKPSRKHPPMSQKVITNFSRSAPPKMFTQHSGSAICPLCGVTVFSGKLIAHKMEAHGEARSGSTVGTNAVPRWTPIYPGGLTGLKK